MKFWFFLLSAAVLVTATRTRAQTSGVIIANASYPSAVTLTGALTAVGSLSFQQTLNGTYPLVVAGDLSLRGDVGAVAPLGTTSVAGRLVFEGTRFTSQGPVAVEGTTELRHANVELTASNWVLGGQIWLGETGTYTLHATSGKISLTGQVFGPGSGSATLRLIAPSGMIEIAKAIPANVVLETSESEPAPSTGRLVNVSTRGLAGSGDGVLIVGFVIEGGEREVLVRAVGPSLRTLGLSGVCAEPQFRLFGPDLRVLATVSNWSALPAAEQAAIRAAGQSAGAMPLTDGAHDAAKVVRLPAGVYSMVVSGAGASPGVVLAEAYELR